MQPHPLRNFLGISWAKFGQNLTNLGKIWTNLGEMLAKVITVHCKIWANLI